MHILTISDLPHFVTGGAEMQAARLIEGWMDRGHEVICIGRRMGKGPVKIGRHLVQVRKIYTLPNLGRPGRGISYLFSLSVLLMRYRRWIDVIYTRFLGEAAIVVSMLKRFGLLDIKLVANPAGTRNQGDVHFLRSIPFTPYLIKLLDEECDAINLISPLMDSELRQAGFSGQNFTHIPNGITIRPLNRASQHNNIKFITVGRIAPEKGLDLFLKAVAQLKNRLNPGQVIIVGSGPEETKLRNQAKELQINELIEWTGHLNQSQVQARLNEADVFVLPSRLEGLSNAGLEAMERGLAPIFSACGGLDTYIDKEIGWVVPCNDVLALSKAMSEALSMPMERIRDMGLQARSLIKQEFDIDIIVDRYLDLFAKLHQIK